MPDRDIYPSITPLPQGVNDPYSRSSHKATNVIAAFDAMRDLGDFMAINDGGLFPGKRYTSANKSSGFMNHFQGIVRLYDSNYIVLSGGDKKNKAGHLFIARLESRSPDSAFRSNTPDRNKPFAEDKVVKTICVSESTPGLDPELWHAGGIAVCGDILACPVEGDPGSEVIFYNMRDPEAPRIFATESRVKRAGVQAGAVALTLLPSDYYLLAVISVCPGGNDHCLDLYLSIEKSIEKGFSKFQSWRTSDEFPNCQNMSFVNENDTTIYLITTLNTSKVAPLANASDMAYLFRLDFTPADLRRVDPQTVRSVSITRVGQRHLRNKHKGRARTKFRGTQCNFSAGSGIYVHSRGALMLYSCYTWRDHHVIRFSEFRPDPSIFTPPMIDSIDDAWIDLYEDDSFEARQLGIYGEIDAAKPDYSKIAVQGITFNDKVSSVRYQLPPGRTYRLYKRKNYELKGGNDHFDLKGNGSVSEVTNLKDAGFGDKVSSSKYL